MTFRGGIKNCFFWKNSERGGGVSPNPKFNNQKKFRCFFDFFFKRGGVSPIPKGCYHKKKKLWIFGYFRQKGGSHPIYRDFIIKKLRIFQNFSPKGGRGS